MGVVLKSVNVPSSVMAIGVRECQMCREYPCDKVSKRSPSIPPYILGNALVTAMIGFTIPEVLMYMFIESLCP